MSRDDKPGTIFTFVLGVSVGALAALLLAPKSGDELRADILDGASDGVKHVRAGSQKLKRKVEKVVADAQDQVADAIGAGEDAYREAKG
jgi:gas vesicle protein